MPKQIPWFQILIGFAILYGLVTPFQLWVNGIFGIAAPEAVVEPGVTPVTDFCADPSVTMRIGPMIKMYAPGTAVTGEFARLFVGGVDQGLKQDSTTFGVSWKDKIDIYYAENSTTYYAAHSSFEVPCKSTIDSAKFDNDAHKLYQLDASTDLNLKVFCEDDGLLAKGTGGTATESIAAGDTLTLDASLQGNYEDAYSPYGDIYVTIKYNSTAYDEFELKASTPGFTFTKGATTPTFRSVNQSATGYNLDTWKLSPGLISNQKVDFTIYVDADDTNDPVPAEGGNFTIYYDDEDWYRNSDTGKMEFGPENNDDADIGSTNTMHKTVEVA